MLKKSQKGVDMWLNPDIIRISIRSDLEATRSGNRQETHGALNDNVRCADESPKRSPRNAASMGGVFVSGS